jgi:hypothetical protein
MFKAIYDSPVTATLLPCIAALATAAFAVKAKASFVRLYGSVFAVAIAADAFLNGPWTPVKGGTLLASAVGVLFVIAGDLRYFVAIEHVGSNAWKLPRAVAWACVVPAIAQIVRLTVPRIAIDERSTYLVYEILFFALAAGIRVFRVPRARNVMLAKRVTQLELVQYGAWILADVGLVTTGRGAFYAVRLVANLIYYVAFVPVVVWLLARDEEVVR